MITRRQVIVGGLAAAAVSPALAATAETTEIANIFRLDWWQLEHVARGDDGLYRFQDLQPIFTIASLVIDPVPALTVWTVHCDERTKKNRAVFMYAREGEAEATADRLNEVCTARGVDRLIVRRGTIPGVHVPTLAIHPGMGLLERAYAVQSLFRDGCVSAPGVIDENDIVRFIDWADMAQIELCCFPHASKDNITRSAIQGLEHLRDTGFIGRTA